MLSFEQGELKLFEQGELKRLLGDDLLQGTGFLAQRLDLVARRRARRVTGQAAVTVRRGA
jgi:hypothetical protein